MFYTASSLRYFLFFIKPNNMFFLIHFLEVVIFNGCIVWVSTLNKNRIPCSCLSLHSRKQNNLSRFNAPQKKKSPCLCGSMWRLWLHASCSQSLQEIVPKASGKPIAAGILPRKRKQEHTSRSTDMETEFQDGKMEVIEAWYMDDSQEDQRLTHHREPKEFIPLEKLSELGIISWRLNPDNWENDENLKKIREARGYSYMDICDVCPEKLPNYETKIKNFFEEHLHTDEEIRYCLEGSGYFDVRDENDQWIRVAVKKGGMIVLPAGMYHRFTLDSDNYIKAMRLFVGEPVWTPYNRPHDHLPARKEYLDKILEAGGGKQAVEAR